MDVRLARPTDAPVVLGLTLDERAHLVRNPDWPVNRSIARAAARSLLSLGYPGRTWLAIDGDSAALLEARARQYVIGWDITRLAVHGERSTVLPAVVDAVARHLYSRGVPRLFARCQDEAREELSELGFRPLAREYVFTGRARPIPESEPLPGDGRYRMPQDAWPIHQLESEITPPLVRQLEGLTSMEWSQGRKSVSEIVVERDGRVVAWIGWGSGRMSGTHQLGLLVHPSHAELAGPLLEHVLNSIPDGTTLMARVRDYQPETVNALAEAGLEIVAEEILMVRHGRVALVPAETSRLRVAHVSGIGVLTAHMAIPGSGGWANGRPPDLRRKYIRDCTA